MQASSERASIGDRSTQELEAYITSLEEQTRKQGKEIETHVEANEQLRSEIKELQVSQSLKIAEHGLAQLQSGSIQAGEGTSFRRRPRKTSADPEHSAALAAERKELIEAFTVGSEESTGRKRSRPEGSRRGSAVFQRRGTAAREAFNNLSAMKHTLRTRNSPLKGLTPSASSQGSGTSADSTEILPSPEGTVALGSSVPEQGTKSTHEMDQPNEPNGEIAEPPQSSTDSTNRQRELPLPQLPPLAVSLSSISKQGKESAHKVNAPR